MVIGEIHTGLLQHSTALTTETTAELLALIPQHGVRSWERPIRQVASPGLLTGVDCDLPARSGSRVRAIGTVSTEVRVTSGQLLQSATQVRIEPGSVGRRRPWSHYLSRPGVMESMAELKPDDVVTGFFGDSRPSTALDLSGLAARTMGTVQASPLLDRRPPFTAARTRLRWSAEALPSGATRSSSLRFTLERDGLRTLRLSAPAEVLAELPELCQDVARHDWLLSSLTAMLDTARTSNPEKGDVIRRLQPAVDHLVHAWMPATRLSDETAGFWAELERRSGFTRQWNATVGRIRDQVALAAAEYLGAVMKPRRNGRDPQKSPTQIQLPGESAVHPQ